MNLTENYGIIIISQVIQKGTCMANEKELRAEHRNRLYQLLKIQKLNPHQKINGLSDMIENTLAVIDPEDAIHVKKILTDEN